MRRFLFLVLGLAVFGVCSIGLGWLRAGWLGVILYGAICGFVTGILVWATALHSVGSIRAERRALRAAEKGGSRRRIAIARMRVAVARRLKGYGH